MALLLPHAYLPPPRGPAAAERPAPSTFLLLRAGRGRGPSANAAQPLQQQSAGPGGRGLGRRALDASAVVPIFLLCGSVARELVACGLLGLEQGGGRGGSSRCGRAEELDG
ncbi:hypothetical protein GQ55_6G164400 [Panicum hallii var. hallii]|uniref:Uncharacterized protein n=1 Tax=Panicum hallii var. hallii TaxID=1504633 RepID=A0A2T7D6L5_9POAL|nr:hypothetical protein GQ55_6G164400 [Panicum hallii var. hallii]